MKPFDDMATQYFTVEAVGEKSNRVTAHLAVGIPRRAIATDPFGIDLSAKASRYLLNRIAVRVEEVAQEELKAFIDAQGK